MKLARIGLSWALYGAGDAVSCVMDYWPWERYHPYFVYSWLMHQSDRLQGDDPRGPWHPVSYSN